MSGPSEPVPVFLIAAQPQGLDGGWTASPRMESPTLRCSPLSSGHPFLTLLALWLREEYGNIPDYLQMWPFSARRQAGWVGGAVLVEFSSGEEQHEGVHRHSFAASTSRPGGEERLAGTCPAASRARMRRFLSRKGRFSLRQSKSGTRSASKDFCKSCVFVFICWSWNVWSARGDAMRDDVLAGKLYLAQAGEILTIWVSTCVLMGARKKNPSAPCQWFPDLF